MIRALFFIALITLLVVYVPDNTRIALRETINSVYYTGRKVLKIIYPEASRKLNDLVIRKPYDDSQQVSSNISQKQYIQDIEMLDTDELDGRLLDNQVDLGERKEMESFFDENRDKLVELMNMLEVEGNGTDQ